MKRFILSLIVVFSYAYNAQSQENTVGLISYVPSEVMDGYNLIFPHRQPNAYLLDNCGEIVHTWQGEEGTVPGNVAYLLPNGNLVKTIRPAIVTEDPIWAGGGGATVEIRTWENELVWEYTKNDSLERLHHDIAIKENGNILMIVWEYMSEEDAIQAGRDPALITQAAVWPDKIIEVDQNKNIVWEWHSKDHLIQDFDATKDNFGVIADNPGKINFNLDTNLGKADWLHSNAMDYNEERGQILLSVPQFDEVWVIDNTTTTEQAAGTTGGRGNVGGEIMYRWGNPAAYGAGTVEDQTLFYQHDVKWVDDFISPAHPDFGNFMVFNNRIGEDFSTVTIFDPGWDMYKWRYTKNTDGSWAPEEAEKNFTHPTPQKMWSTGLSSAQALANGNYLMCTGRFGYSFELNPDDEVVWEYVTPIIIGAQATQGDSLEINDNLTFRMNRYPADYPAFEGRELDQIGFIEIDPNEDFCDRVLSTNGPINLYGLKLSPNPASDILIIDFNEGKEVDFKMFDLLGRQIHEFKGMGGRKYLDISSFENGIYFIQINNADIRKLVIN